MRGVGSKELGQNFSWFFYSNLPAQTHAIVVQRVGVERPGEGDLSILYCQNFVFFPFCKGFSQRIFLLYVKINEKKSNFFQIRWGEKGGVFHEGGFFTIFFDLYWFLYYNLNQ